MPVSPAPSATRGVFGILGWCFRIFVLIRPRSSSRRWGHLLLFVQQPSNVKYFVRNIDDLKMSRGINLAKLGISVKRGSKTLVCENLVYVFCILVILHSNQYVGCRYRQLQFSMFDFLF